MAEPMPMPTMPVRLRTIRQSYLASGPAHAQRVQPVTAVLLGEDGEVVLVADGRDCRVALTSTSWAAAAYRTCPCCGENHRELFCRSSGEYIGFMQKHSSLDGLDLGRGVRDYGSVRFALQDGSELQLAVRTESGEAAEEFKSVVDQLLHSVGCTRYEETWHSTRKSRAVPRPQGRGCPSSVAGAPAEAAETKTADPAGEAEAERHMRELLEMEAAERRPKQRPKRRPKHTSGLADEATRQPPDRDSPTGRTACSAKATDGAAESGPSRGPRTQEATEPGRKGEAAGTEESRPATPDCSEAAHTPGGEAAPGPAPAHGVAPPPEEAPEELEERARSLRGEQPHVADAADDEPVAQEAGPVESSLEAGAQWCTVYSRAMRKASRMRAHEADPARGVPPSAGKAATDTNAHSPVSEAHAGDNRPPSRRAEPAWHLPRTRSVVAEPDCDDWMSWLDEVGTKSSLGLDSSCDEPRREAAVVSGSATPSETGVSEKRRRSTGACGAPRWLAQLPGPVTLRAPTLHARLSEAASGQRKQQPRPSRPAPLVAPLAPRHGLLGSEALQPGGGISNTADGPAHGQMQSVAVPSPLGLVQGMVLPAAEPMALDLGGRCRVVGTAVAAAPSTFGHLVADRGGLPAQPGEEDMALKAENLVPVSHEEYDAWVAEQSTNEPAKEDLEEMLKSKVCSGKTRWTDSQEIPLLRKPGIEGNEFDILMGGEPDGALAARKIADIIKERGVCLVEANAPSDLLCAAYEEAEKMYKALPGDSVRDPSADLWWALPRGLLDDDEATDFVQ
mmetsp:Transcript_96061/g.299660  ORF Transcript_96061/g.299660 Transcript_96061/m.299660 type:complete len:790 (+) Transcript_96061:30-2399(+)